MKILLFTFAVSGAILALIALPLINRRIKPNLWYGFRVRATLEDEGLWYAVNAHGGQRLLIAGLVTMISALGLYFIPNLSLDTYAVSMAVIAIGTLSIGFAQTFRYLDHLKREKLS